MKTIFIASTLLVGIFSMTAFAAPAPKVAVCHIPPGNPDNYHTINISENALAAHLAHGDLGGFCHECDEVCNDGNACTIDHNDDCEQNGCLAEPIPVDCSDGNLCTVDSCNPNTGCTNTPVTCIAPDLCTVSACASETGQCEESPVVCPAGYSCDLGTGSCAPDAACAVDNDCSADQTCISGECIDGSARNLRGPDTGSCDGPEIGYTTVVVLQSDAGLQVDVEYSNGPANVSHQVFWVCTEVGGGCHGDACGYVDLGTITTDGSGSGFFSTVLPDGNPFPGYYVHFDLGGVGDIYSTSITHDEIFPATSAALSSSTAATEIGAALDPAEARE